MSKVLYVGLDYHQNSVQVCVLDKDRNVIANRSVINQWMAIRQVLGDHTGPVHAAIEMCNGAADLADELVTHAGWSVDLAHPGYVQRMRQNRDKTDLSDARLLADLERVGYLPRVWHAPQYIRDLRHLVGYRAKLVARRRNLKLSIGAALRNARVQGLPPSRWSRAWVAAVKTCDQLTPMVLWTIRQQFDEIESVQAKLKAVEEQFALHTKADPLVARLMTHKGVGLVTACIMRAHIGRFDRFTKAKQLSRFCGLSPRNVSSGARQADAGLMDACDRHLRATLMETAHRLKRTVPRWPNR